MEETAPEESPVVCCECLAEPALEGQTIDELALEGWDVAGEFGVRCPECAIVNAPPATTEGLDGVAASLGASKKEG